MDSVYVHRTQGGDDKIIHQIIVHLVFIITLMISFVMASFISSANTVQKIGI